MNRTKWILCPICGNKTRDRIREDSVLKNYPLYCPKCKNETLISAENLRVIVIDKQIISKSSGGNLSAHTTQI